MIHDQEGIAIVILWGCRSTCAQIGLELFGLGPRVQREPEDQREELVVFGFVKGDFSNKVLEFLK